MGRAVFPPCCLTWGQAMVEVMKITVTSFKRSMHALPHSVAPALQQATVTHASAGDSWTLMGKSGSVSCGVIIPSSWFWCTQASICALQESVSPVLCKFWQLYGGVNGDLLQEGFCHTQVCCTQSPCPWGRPLLTCTSTGDAHTLKGRSCSVPVGTPRAHKVLFEPSKLLWWVCGLIVNVISPLLPSCWGFSFGCGVSFFGGIEHSLVYGCSAVSCNFGVLAGEDEHTFYCAIL